MSTPAVSAVVATYNYGRFLAGALDSALGQTFGDLEVIVVDDGSTDNTETVVAPYLRDPRVHYHRTDHVGQSAAKNMGIRLARARLIGFLDADDLWLPEKLEKQVVLCEREPDVGVVYTRRALIDPDGRALEYRQPDSLPRGNVVTALVQNNFVCFSSAVVRQRVFAEVGGFDESLSLAIDYDLWLRVGLRFSFDFVDEPLVQYRTGHANLSRRAEERLGVAAHILRRFLDERGGRAAVPPSVVRRAWAETYYHIGLATRGRSRLSALQWYFRSVLLAPTFGLAWKGVGALFLPETWRRRLRIACGRPPEWSVRKRAEEDPVLGAAYVDPNRPTGRPPHPGPTLIRSEV
jgi:glycosyltransferase involved in cell wall biosynthesis